jgi:hypothetical protein
MKKFLFIPRIGGVSPCGIFFQTSNSPTQVFSYDVNNQISTFRFSGTTAAVDIATTSDRLWLDVYGTTYEYIITLNPFTYSYNRTITMSGGNSNGLCAKDNTHLIGSQGNGIYSFDISSNPAPANLIFNMQSGRNMTGDLFYNSALDRYIISNYNLTNYYITEYASDGTVIKDLSVTQTDIYGLYVESGDIYAICGSGDIYIVGSSGLTFVNNCGLSVYGASQHPACTQVVLP